MNETQKTIVLDLMKTYPVLRGDDFLLYLAVLEVRGVNTRESMLTLLSKHNELGLPSFASIVRLRRLLQQEDISLLPAKKIIEERNKETERVLEVTKGYEINKGTLY